MTTSSRELEARRKGYRSILGIVNAMKALSASNLRKGSAALAHTRKYRGFIESAASVAAGLPGVSLLGEEGKSLIVVFGSQFGLCGSFNARVAESAEKAALELKRVVGRVLVGRRLIDQAAETTDIAEDTLEAPGSVEGVAETVAELLSLVYDKYRGKMFDELWFLVPTFEADAMHTRLKKIMPPAFEPQPESEPPLTYIPAEDIMEGIIEEYIYVELYAAALEAVIAENEVRIRSMDFAARNIKKKIEELTRAYNYAHQEEVTSELLEIIAGYEAARKAAGDIL